MSYTEIGARYGVDQSAIQHWLKRHDIPRPTVWGTRRRGVVVHPPSVKEVANAYSTGQSLRGIGDRYGVSAKSIRKVCTEGGIAVHQRGWPVSRRQYICLDGHMVSSSLEQRVDNWLHEHGVSHLPSPSLPFDRRYRADFLVHDTYIEVWGVTNSASYDERRSRKVSLYRETGLKLIELPLSVFAHSAEWELRLEVLLAH